MTDSSETGQKVRIHGRVQGVWYRGWMVRQANALGLRGWVRNRMDGTVEALVAGPREQVSAMVEACHAGPPAARVDAVVVEPVASDECARLTPSFEQRTTE